MKKYLSNLLTAIMCDIPCIDAVIGHEVAKANEMDNTEYRCNNKFCADGKNVYSIGSAFPQGAVTIRNGRMVASPEFLFLELACKLSIHRLILLGLQLCSHPPGRPSVAITAKQKIGAFLENATGCRGHRKAKRALKYVENGAASIMESLAYMILGLPNALGGYGLKGAVFNHEVRLSEEAKTHLKQDCCFVDLYYKKGKVGVEYDSCAYHSSPSEQGNDAVRSAVLRRKGIKVMHLYTIQLYDRDACKVFAYNLAARLGKRINIRTKRFDEMNTLLRQLLPDGKTGN